MKYTQDYSAQIKTIKDAVKSADAVLVGAGSGLSSAAGLTYSGERFIKYFADFHDKYGINDMYSGGFYPFDSLEEYWAWWSRHIWYNRYATDVNSVYKDLLALVKDKDYFVLTTNVDHCFQSAGFNKKRLFYTQGDYGLFQCSVSCHNKTYDNKATVKEMAEKQKDMKIPSELIPYCPVCGKPMTVNLRCDDTFVQDDGWYAAKDGYSYFLQKNSKKRIVLLELGVGGNTPAIIKYPFWRLAYSNEKAFYVCINNGEAVCPQEIKRRSVCINADIKTVIKDLL
ncbi:MAG: Sir2 silent information regulator family NAD-dependent deacetylase [Clostridia bacterium]|nr:Sir2 silent information regulator family NAD-dependent deacetylase [Clostridia bacterium]